MYLEEIFNLATLKKYITDGYIGEQSHPTLPLKILNYTPKAQFERKWDAYTTACRGLIYETKHNAIVARPFPKFFNVGEAGGLTMDKLLQYQREGHTVKIFEKLDGSLGILWQYSDPYTGKLTKGVATRGSFTSPMAVWATKWFDARCKAYNINWEEGSTPLVEILYPENRIVVKYDFSGLVVLGLMKHNGTEYIRRVVRAWAINSRLPVVKSYSGKRIEDLAKETRTNFEGYVICANVGTKTYRAKVKLEEYCRLHKMTTGWNAKSVWEQLKCGAKLDLTIGDATLPEHFRKWLETVCEVLIGRYNQLEMQAVEAFAAVTASINRLITDAPTRKQWAFRINKYPELAPILFKMLDKQDYSDIIWDKIKPNAAENFILDEAVAAEGAV